MSPADRALPRFGLAHLIACNTGCSNIFHPLLKPCLYPLGVVFVGDVFHREKEV